MKKLFVVAIMLLGMGLNSLNAAPGFTVSGNELLDANGNPFVMRGFNIPLSWYVNDVNSNIANMRNATQANTMRIVVNTSTSDSDWQTAVQLCIANNVIPMVELHDVTGSNSTNDLQSMANWWASKAWFLTDPDIEPYILINIANEWGDWSMSSPNHSPSQTVWRDAYINAVQTLRSAGIVTTIVVDAPGYGQDNQASSILNYGWDIVGADPLSNVLFSVHMYCEWQVGGNSDVNYHLGLIQDAGLAVIVGEFGWQHEEGNGLCDIDENAILSQCQSRGIGYLAWSWKGNGSCCAFLDLSNDWAGNDLSSWGNTIVWSTNGIRNTSQDASVFSGIGGGGNGCGTQDGFPICCDPSSDPDGDGWGWENNQSCIVDSSGSGNGGGNGCGTQDGFPICCDPSSDPDGDGWGWENNQSCIVDSSGGGNGGGNGCGTQDGFPICCDPSSDPDGDGWGWENNQSCIVASSGDTAPNGYPYCQSASSDPDGDGWGWENNQSCVVR